jgi:hypothetical protein
MEDSPKKTGKEQKKKKDNRQPPKEYQFKPGQSGNPAGRPKRGWSIKDKFWQRFENAPDELEKFMNELVQKYPGLVWQMMEGKPPQDLNVGGSDLPFIIKVEKIDGNRDDKGEDNKAVPEAV